jgi:hypothetical protein
MHNGMSAHSAKESHADLHDRIEQRFAVKYAEQVAHYEEVRKAEIEKPLLERIAELEKQVFVASKIINNVDDIVLHKAVELLNSFGYSGAEADAYVYGEKG